MLAVFTVTNLNDSVVNAAGQAPGTLRQAVFDANNLPGADVIQFSAGLSGAVNLSVIGNSTDGASALLVTSDITIRGNANGITLQRGNAAPEMRLFRVAVGGDLTLETIMLTGGLARGAAGDSPGQVGGIGRGGAILNQGTLEVIASTLYGNTAIGGNASGASGGQGLGGAVANLGGTIIVKNSTWSGNSVSSGAGNTTVNSWGGAIHSLEGLIQIYNSTFTLNTASTGRHVYAISETSTVTLHLHSSIFAQQENSVAIRDVFASFDNVGQAIVTGSKNIVRAQNGLDDTQPIFEDPLLGPLANNGGPTLTHAILPGSPAADAGTNVLGMATDQRGATFLRLRGAAVDIGAFEAQGSLPELGGDYNRDGATNAADYVLWRKTIGRSVANYAEADGNGNGSIDPPDYIVWSEHFGETAEGAGGGVQQILPLVLTSQDSVPASIDWATFGTADRATNVKQTDDKVSELISLDRASFSSAVRDKALLAAFIDWEPEAGAGRTTPDMSVVDDSP